MNTKHIHQNEIIYGVKVMLFNVTFNDIFKLYIVVLLFCSIGGNRSIRGKPPVASH